MSLVVLGFAALMAGAGTTATPGPDVTPASVFGVGVNGQGLRQLAKDPAGLPVFVDARPSADGRWLAFFERSGGGGHRLFVMHPDGRELRLVADVQTGAASPSIAWSADGKRVAITTERAGVDSGHPVRDLAVVSIDDGDVRTVVPDAQTIDPVFSPDGRFIAYDRSGEVFAVSVNGGQPRLVAHGAWPAWAPDSRHLSFSIDSEGAAIQPGHLASIDLKTGRIQRYHVVSYAPALWSPNGKWIAVALNENGPPVGLVAVRRGRLTTLRPTGCSGNNPPYPIAMPLAWSRDSKALALRDGGVLLVSDPLGRRPRAVAGPGCGGVVAAWWPDRKHLRFVAYPA